MEGWDLYTTKLMWYINFGVYNSGDFKNEISFPIRIPPYPNTGVAMGVRGTYTPLKIMWCINYGVFNRPIFTTNVGYRSLPPWDALVGRSEGILKEKLNFFFWNPNPWKPQNWYITFLFVVCRFQYPCPPTSAVPLLRSEGILKGKLISFLKSWLLKAPELIYHIIDSKL